MAAPPDNAPPDNDVLWARGLHYAYSGSPALQGVSLAVRAGEIVSVTGPRGSGKTTLLSCLSGQLTPREGEVWFNSVPVHTLRRSARERLRRDRFGWIGSSPQLVPELTAWENVALPLLLNGTGHRAARKTAREWLDRLDVGRCARKRPGALCQAERQRVAIARALAPSPTVLFADEPAAVLHQRDRTLALRTLTTAARSHDITVLLATHEPAVMPPEPSPDDSAARPKNPMLADRTLVLVDGRLDAGGTLSTALLKADATPGGAAVYSVAGDGPAAEEITVDPAEEGASGAVRSGATIGESGNEAGHASEEVDEVEAPGAGSSESAAPDPAPEPDAEPAPSPVPAGGTDTASSGNPHSDADATTHPGSGAGPEPGPVSDAAAPGPDLDSSADSGSDIDADTESGAATGSDAEQDDAKSGTEDGRSTGSGGKSSAASGSGGDGQDSEGATCSLSV